MGYEKPPLELIRNGFRRKFRQFEQNNLKLLDDSPDLDIPFIYLPLHYTPETGDMFFGWRYDHHAGFVSQLAKHIPSECTLYVKEHTSMAGMRPSSFYRELNAICNVRVISPAVSTFSLIQNSTAVATVVGTAGWEAFLLGRPVIALGNVFYNFLPNVFHEKFSYDFEQKLRTYIENFEPNTTEIKNAFRAFYASAFRGSNDVNLLIKMGNATSNKSLEENAQKFAKSVKRVMTDWGHTINNDAIRKNES
jgi:hypothetical protein